MTDASAIIEVTDLDFAYNGEKIFDGASFAIQPGQFAMMVGPNGGGKTTLLKLLLGLLRPTAGRCLVLGSSPQQVRKRLGYVPQHIQLDPKFPVSVLDVVLMGCLGRTRLLGPYRGSDRRRARAALEQVGLADQAGGTFASLSGGQRQRVLIARCLAGEPELLLLDEPTSNLDAAAEQDFFQLLSRLNEKLTVVLVSHDVGFVTQFVDTVVCVNRSVSVHPTAELTGANIAELYQQDIRLVRHDHNCAGGHAE
ncbi:MAG: metal ABC transporter ATP-binding protein [Phycisphaerae bacterium]